VRVLEKHKNLKEDNFNKNKLNQRLVDDLSLKNKIIENLKDKLKAKKIASTMVGSKEDKLVTKQKIGSLIRDIDKCISLISE